MQNKYRDEIVHFYKVKKFKGLNKNFSKLRDKKHTYSVFEDKNYNLPNFESDHNFTINFQLV